MPTPRRSAEIHRLTGTFRNDRHATAGIAVEPFDTTPPAHLGDAERAAWAELVQGAEPFLAASDRISVELAACLLVRSRTEVCTPSLIAQLVGLLRGLGLTPGGRAALDRVTPPKAANPFDVLDS